MRFAGPLLFLAGPAFADPALLSFEFVEQSILATGEDIELVELTLDYGGRQAVSVRLHPSFDARFAEVTETNIGKVMAVRICGDLIVEPMLAGQLLKAEFIITTGNNEEAGRLVNLLKTKTCPDQQLG